MLLCAMTIVFCMFKVEQPRTWESCTLKLLRASGGEEICLPWHHSDRPCQYPSIDHGDQTL
jgi:hypothetical protein